MMAKRITIGWDEYRIIDRSKREPGMFYIQVRQKLFGRIPTTPWASIYVNYYSECIEVLKELQRKHYQKFNKTKTIEVDIPLGEIYS